jgi:selenocysteine lyase/cysteine desulfurase
VSKECKYDLQRIQFQFDDVRPELMIVSHASNVTGLIAPVLDIFELAKRYDAITVVDMAQTAGLVDLDIGLNLVDFAVFDGHKTLMGPTGISGFIMKSGFDLPPVIFGGTGFESANQDMPNSLPQKYEMGTMNSIGVAGLNAALKWIQDQTIEIIREKDCDNRLQLIKLLRKYDFLDIVGVYDDCEYVGIVSCLMEGVSSDSAGNIFSEKNIAVRTGLQCAPLAHQFLGTYPAGTIRFSISCLTSEADFYELKDALDEIASEM